MDGRSWIGKSRNSTFHRALPGHRGLTQAAVGTVVSGVGVVDQHGRIAVAQLPLLPPHGHAQRLPLVTTGEHRTHADHPAVRQQQRLIPLVVGRCWPVPDPACPHGSRPRSAPGRRVQREAAEGALANAVLPRDGRESSVEANGEGVPTQARPAPPSACTVHRQARRAVEATRKAPPHGLPVGSSRWRGFSGFQGALLRTVLRGVASRSCSASIFLMFVGLAVVRTRARFSVLSTRNSIYQASQSRTTVYPTSKTCSCGMNWEDVSLRSANDEVSREVVDFATFSLAAIPLCPPTLFGNNKKRGSAQLNGSGPLICPCGCNRLK